jgi:hypothetical protein
VCAAVVVGVDAAPVLEVPDHVLDLLALLVEVFVVVDLDLAVGLGRGAGRNATLDEAFAEPVGIISLVAKQMFCHRYCYKLLRWLA